VLRNGGLVGTVDPASLSRLELIRMMLGRTLTVLDDMAEHKIETRRSITADAFLEAEGLGATGSIEPFDLQLHKGEVLGLAGLLGSGRTELAQLLFGIDRPDSGTLRIDGETVTEHSPAAAIRRGIGLAPEDRKAEGIVADLSVRENIILAMQASRGWLRYLGAKEQSAIAERYIKLLNIATPSPDQPVKNLSGGNQQKVILARWLATDPQLLILDEPTRGIDVGTKADIQKLVLDLAEEGRSCVFISSELEEVLRTSHRVVVLRDRAKVTEFGGELEERAIMQAMAGSES
jgi:galactofuranose transport system ATP-binding protein